MLPVLLMMQAAGEPAPPPPAPVPPPWTAPERAAPPAPPPQPPQAGAPPPYGAYPYPYYPYPYPYPPQAYPPQAYPPASPPAAPPREPEPEREVTWFVRINVGLGPPSFSAESDLLRLEGYGGAKFWAMLDGGYLFHPNIGFGAWIALSHRSSSPHENAPTLNETSYFVGGELPIKLGSRSISVVLSPRLGFCSGAVDLGGNVPFQSAPAYGGELSLTSFKYHLTGSVGLLRAAVGPPGELGRDHDLGGLYVVIGGTIDG